MRIAEGAARGINRLHQNENIIHGNLTASNILLDARSSPALTACISDFGLSRLMTPAANANVVATAGSLGYRAPELTKLKKATTKSDVYSFGIVLLELLTGMFTRSLPSSVHVVKEILWWVHYGPQSFLLKFPGGFSIELNFFTSST